MGQELGWKWGTEVRRSSHLQGRRTTERGCLSDYSEDQLVAATVLDTSACCNPQERGKKSELTELIFLPPGRKGAKEKLNLVTKKSKRFLHTWVWPEIVHCSAPLINMG